MEGLGSSEKNERGGLNPEGKNINFVHAEDLLLELETFMGTPLERIELIESARPEVDAFVKIAKSISSEAEVVAIQLQEALRQLSQTH